MPEIKNDLAAKRRGVQKGPPMAWDRRKTSAYERLNAFKRHLKGVSLQCFKKTFLA